MQKTLKNIQTESSNAKLNYTEKHHYKSYKSMPQHPTTTTKQQSCFMKNAKIGVRNINDKMKCTGPFGRGNRNERGERLLAFAEENNLVVTNSLFFKAANRYWAWEAPEGVTKNQIDFIRSSDRKIVRNCEVITKVDIGSDHRMVRARVEIDKKLMRLKRIQKQKPY